MTGAEMMIQVLAQEGVDTIFGYTGGAILPTYDAIFRYNVEHESNPSEQIQLIVPANEQGAGFMAAGYARASGKVGVFIVTSGPAATNSVTPIRDCMADSVPVVLICGQVARNAIGTDAFQEAPGLQSHEFLRQACVSRGRTRRPGKHGAHGVRNRPERPPRPRGHRCSQRRSELGGQPSRARECSISAAMKTG